MRSETEIRDVNKLFTATGDDPPALNTAVRDTLTWVLGGIPTEELISEYCVKGENYHCWTCPAGWSGEKNADQECTPVDVLPQGVNNGQET